jgi:hypothetical protein
MTKIYPSQKKYNIDNPPITFRMKKEDKVKIDKLAEVTGKSIGDLAREFFFHPEKGIFEFFHHGIHEGLQIASEQNGFYFYCAVCGEKIYISPNSEIHNAVIQYLEQQGWGHAGCIDNNR